MLKVLINGGGIAGLAAANALKRLCPLIQYTVIEKSGNLRPEGASIALPANAVEGLALLGLEDALLSKARQVQHIRYMTHTGELLSERPLSALQQNHPFVSIRRSDLLHLLKQDIPVCFNRTIDSIKQNIEGCEVTFDDGYHHLFDLVIDASGVHSSHRERVLGRDLRVDLGLSCWRFTTPAFVDQPSFYLLHPSATAALLYPTSDNQTYGYLHKPAENNDDALKKSDLLEIFDNYPNKVIEAINGADSITHNPTISIDSPVHYDDTRTAFVGDAASACSPMLQQGAASALEDVISLAYTLSVLTDNSWDSIRNALSTYRKLRSPRAQWVKDASDKPFQAVGSALPEGVRENLKQGIRSNGPLNMQGWAILFKTNAYAEAKKMYVEG